MASRLSCKCVCGYQAEAWTATTRAGHGKHFNWPHLCRGCKQVVSVDIYTNPEHCPECQTTEITRYGLLIPDPPTDKTAQLIDALTPSRRRYKKQIADLYNSRVDMSYAFRNNATYGLPRQAYECPHCAATELNFALDALFD